MVSQQAPSTAYKVSRQERTGEQKRCCQGPAPATQGDTLTIQTLLLLWPPSPAPTTRHPGPVPPRSHTYSFQVKKTILGTSLVVQWLRLQVPKAGGLGSIPGKVTSSHVPPLKTVHATTNIEDPARRN